jgi:hypothetical protein
VQDEGINVRAELATDERDAMRHQAADEMNVARQPVELGDGDGVPLPRRQASARAAASCGRRSSASAPLPVFALPSTNCDGGHSERRGKMVKFS